jgi:hypothetical protein
MRHRGPFLTCLPLYQAMNIRLAELKAQAL